MHFGYNALRNRHCTLAVLPSSPSRSTRDASCSNIDIWAFLLSDEDMSEISKLDIGHSEIMDHSAPKFVQLLHQMKNHA